jgi:prepilin-type N-terminal cleavage/methylation domain-containing protein
VSVPTHVREEAGFGLVELLIAMTVMAIGISAIVAGLSSGLIAVNRARDASTAAAVADKQIEAYRALPNCSIYLDSATIPGSGPYVSDSAYSVTQVTTNTPLIGTAACTGSPGSTLTTAQQPLTGADGKTYNVDTYIVASSAVSGTLAKKVTLVVKNSDSSKTLLRESSTFAPPTGCNNPSGSLSAGC